MFKFAVVIVTAHCPSKPLFLTKKLQNERLSLSSVFYYELNNFALHTGVSREKDYSAGPAGLSFLDLPALRRWRILLGQVN